MDELDTIDTLDVADDRALIGIDNKINFFSKKIRKIEFLARFSILTISKINVENN